VVKVLTWRVRIAVLWITAAVSQTVGVFLLLFQPGAVTDLMSGHLMGEDVTDPGTQVITVSYSLAPMVLAFLTLVLNGPTARKVNALLGATGALYGVAALVSTTWTLRSVGLELVGVVQLLVPLLVLWHVWKWPTPEVRQSYKAAEPHTSSSTPR
jgi:hypothetical protein